MLRDSFRKLLVNEPWIFYSSPEKSLKKVFKVFLVPSWEETLKKTNEIFLKIFFVFHFLKRNIFHFAYFIMNIGSAVSLNCRLDLFITPRTKN